MPEDRVFRTWSNAVFRPGCKKGAGRPLAFALEQMNGDF
jgi:hypothetical protein